MAYIYALKDKSTGEVRYIGKANDPAKRLSSHMYDSRKRNSPVHKWIRKNGTPEMVILAGPIEDWESEEIRLIAEYREKGFNLLNVAKGGNQPYCPKEVSLNNAKKAVLKRDKRLWAVKQKLGSCLKSGYGSETLKKRMRNNPDIFGDFAWWYQGVGTS